MIKKSKLAYVIGTIVIIISLMFTVLLVVALGFSEDKEKLVISSASVEKVYDGTALTSTGWSITKGKLAENHRIEVDVFGSITDVGETENIFSVKITDKNDKDVTDSYEIEHAAGTLKVNKRPIYIKSESATKEYDATPLVNEYYQVTGSLVGGHSLDVEFVNDIVDAGVIENMFVATVFNNFGKDVTQNYEIEKGIGTLCVEQREIMISTPSMQGVYDGNPIFLREWEYASSKKVLDIHDITVVVDGEQTDVGGSKNTIRSVQITENGADVTKNYMFNFLEGDLVVEPRHIYLQSGSAEKVYDGTPLASKEWTCVSGTLVAGHTIEVYSFNEYVDAGMYRNWMDVVVKNENGGNVTHNYYIGCDMGTITIFHRSISLQSGWGTKVYDGLPISNKEWTHLSGELVDGHRLEVFVPGEFIDAGTHYNGFFASVFDENNRDVTQNYAISHYAQYIIIHPREITIVSATETKYYDDLPLMNKSFSIVGELLENHHIDVEVFGYGLDIGSYENFISASITDDNGEDFTRNYYINKIIGTLTILPREITIRAEGAIKKYDGEALTNPNWEVVSVYGVLEEHTLLVAVSGSQTAAGQSPNKIASVVIIGQSGDVTFNYNITLQEDMLVVFGTLTDPEAGDLDNSGNLSDDGSAGEKSVALRVKSDLDGDIYLRYLSYGYYTGTKWDLASDYESFIDGMYSLNYLNGIALGSMNNKQGSATIESYINNYLLPYYLSMAASDYTIQLSDTEYYGVTALPYTVNYYQYDYLTSGLIGNLPYKYVQLENEYYEYVKTNYLALPQSARDYFMEIAKGFNSDSPDLIANIAEYIQNAATYDRDYDRNMDNESDIALSFLDNYKSGVCRHFATAATLLYRAMGIPARYTTGYAGATKSGEWVEITTESAHAWVEVYISGLGWVCIEATPGGVGGGLIGDDSDGDDGDDDGGDGEIDFLNKLLIKPEDIYKKFEDGDELYATDVKLKGEALLLLVENGYSYTATVEGELKGLGKAKSKITSFTLFDPLGNDVTDEYDITFKMGVLQLYLYELNVKTPSLQKTYDGSPLAGQGNVTYSGLQAGHRIEQVIYDGSQTIRGKSDNSCTLIIFDEDGVDVTDSYRQINDFGSLEISAREIIVRAGSAERVFDGTPLVCDEYSLSPSDGMALAAGDKISVVIEGSVTDFGEASNVIVDVKITNASGKDVTRNYAIAYEDGTLKITE